MKLKTRFFKIVNPNETWTSKVYVVHKNGKVVEYVFLKFHAIASATPTTKTLNDVIDEKGVEISRNEAVEWTNEPFLPKVYKTN